jgi:hypothetical protein
MSGDFTAMVDMEVEIDGEKHTFTNDVEVRITKSDLCIEAKEEIMTTIEKWEFIKNTNRVFRVNDTFLAAHYDNYGSFDYRKIYNTIKDVYEDNDKRPQLSLQFNGDINVRISLPKDNYKWVVFNQSAKVIGFIVNNIDSGNLQAYINAFDMLKPEKP